MGDQRGKTQPLLLTQWGRPHGSWSEFPHWPDITKGYLGEVGRGSPAWNSLPAGQGQREAGEACELSRT